MNKIVQDQLYFLRLLSQYDEVSISPDGKSKWIRLSDVIISAPEHPIGHRSILKNELILEIDNDNWETVRDGTRKIIEVLEKWGARDCYYLSFSGNRSIHVHVFFDLSSIEFEDKTTRILENVDRTEIQREIKSYIMRQIQYASDTIIDLNLSSKHLIRLEGSMNEKSGNPCTMIDKIPDDRPANYTVKIPDTLPSKLWDLSFLKDEINIFLRVHFAKQIKPVTYSIGKPIKDPEVLIEIIRPIFIKGYRHHIILALSGFMKRHNVPFDDALNIVRVLTERDEEKSSRIYSLREIYRADNSKKIPGLPKLLSIIKEETDKGLIAKDMSDEIDQKLREVLP